MRTKADIHEYQQRAISYLYEHDHGLALLPVGAGKTLIGWTAITELMDDGYIDHPIVFAPLRVAQLTWPAEREGWEHLAGRALVAWGGEPRTWSDSDWKTSRILWGQRTNAESRLPGVVDVRKKRELEARIDALTAEERRVNKALRRAKPARALHVTSYENLLWLCELFEPGRSPFDLWMLDEIGKLKNPKSPRYKAIVRHTAEAKIVHGLNATPAPEGFEDLFAQVRIVDGGRLWGKSFHKWREKFFVPADYHGYSWRLQMGARAPLLRDLNTVAFKVDEEQLTYRATMAHSQIPVQLPPRAREAYVEMARKMALAVEGRDDIIAMTAAAASMKLRQITSGFIYDEDGATHVLHEEKQHALADLIESMGREPLLVAYEFAEDLEAIRRVWKNVPYLGQGVSAAKARETIDLWNQRKLPVLAIHPLSAGHGVNLQAGGSHICWYTLPWALESFQQCNGRINRQGQIRACFAHHIIAQDTMDQRVSDALTAKNADQELIIRAVRNI